jgi:hypothetical protein
MKPIQERTWCNDFEIVYEEGNAYCILFKNLSIISQPDFSFEHITENWFRNNGEGPDIKISYTFENKEFVLWTPKKGDYLHLDILYVLNKQVKFSEYRFEYSYQAESVYFINQSEKNQLETNGVIYDSPNTVAYFELIFYNVINQIEAENLYTYEMIEELTSLVSNYYSETRQKKQFISFQQLLRSKLLNKINWSKMTELGMNADGLYEMANKT